MSVKAFLGKSIVMAALMAVTLGAYQGDTVTLVTGAALLGIGALYAAVSVLLN